LNHRGRIGFAPPRQLTNRNTDTYMSNALLDLEIPVTFSCLVVETESRCNARCGMCYQAAGPKGSELIGDHRLSVDKIKGIALAASQIPELGRRLHIAGGEAYLHKAELLSAFAYARDLGHFEEISTTTNAYWAATKRSAAQVAKESADAGVTGMEISWDFWHGPYISAHAVSNCIDACADNGIEPRLRILTTKDHTAAEALDLLRSDSVKRANCVHSATVFSTGRAAKELDPETFHSSGSGPLSIGGACHGSLNLTVNAKGNVYPCCAGADQTDGLAFGNVLSEPLEKIVRRMQASPLLRVLVFNGVSSFYPILEQAGVPLKAEYRNMCEFCYDVFSRPEATSVIKRYFDDATAQAIAAAWQRWQADTGEQVATV
jgi:MoaA/NifB/PqqE/SkfB family radical SAM enzyme